MQEEKGEMPKPRVDCAAELLLSANLPAAYVPDAGQRVDLYRRIALIRTEEQKSDMLDELIDRFGEPPAEAVALLDIALLRSQASGQGIAEIKQQDGRLLLTFAETDFARLSVLCGDKRLQGPSAAERRLVAVPVAAAEPRGGAACHGADTGGEIRSYRIKRMGGLTFGQYMVY